MKSYNIAQQAELCKLAKEKYNNQYDCDLYGRFPWDCELRGRAQSGRTVSLSKSSLGTFVYEVLIRGGQITSFYVFSLTPRASVYPRVWLTLEEYDKFWADTGFILNPPPVAHLN